VDSVLYADSVDMNRAIHIKSDRILSQPPIYPKAISFQGIFEKIHVLPDVHKRP